MCGLFFSTNSENIELEFLKDFSCITARGPDAQTFLRLSGFSFYHCLLSLTGDEPCLQPLVSDNKRYVLLFNGEIYNYRSLREQYVPAQMSLDRASDSEIVFQLIMKFGASILKSFRGVFSLVFVDLEKKSILVARDEFLQKPLYFDRGNGGLCVCSTIAPLNLKERKFIEGDFTKNFFMTFGFIEPEACPGLVQNMEISVVNTDEVEYGCTAIISKYHFPDDLSLSRSKSQLISRLRSEISETVKLYCGDGSKVPVLFSGGSDSLLIAYVLKHELGLQPECFYVDFHGINDKSFERITNDRRQAIDLAAEHGFEINIIGVSRQEYEVESNQFDKLVEFPTDDGLNIFIATKAVKKAGYKYCLTGTGADEFLGGYRHSRALSFLRFLDATRIGIFLKTFIYFLFPPITANARLIKSLVRWSSVSSAFWILVRGDKKFLKSLDPKSQEVIVKKIAKYKDPEVDLYLKLQLLRVGDFAGMFNGVEVRTPFCDQHLVRIICEAGFNSWSNSKFNLYRSFFPDLFKTSKVSFSLKNKRGFVTPASVIANARSISDLRMDIWSRQSK